MTIFFKPPFYKPARFLSIAVVAVLMAFTVPACAQDAARTAGAEQQQDIEDYSETYRQLNLFGDVFERVRAQYVDDIGDEELVESAINGMLVSLDPHSSYLDEDDFEQMQVQTRGEFGGLGIEVTMENGIIKVVSPIDDTPAFEAGMMAGDYITHLDGEPVVGMNLGDAVEQMRGKVGTDITLTVRREGTQEPLEITITRDIITISSVKYEVVSDNIGYIRITTFNQNTESGVKEAIQNIRKEVEGDVVGYILDLRNNPGGLLEQAIAVSDAFLDKGEIVSTRGRHEEDTKRDNATAGDIIEGKPLAVLINGGSASASEIVAGALQDHRRAILLGTKSFGKGSVQTVVPLPGHGAMRLTTARYYTPSGRSIQAKGIDPDIEVKLAKIEQVSVKRVRESDLKNALDKPQENGQQDKDAPAQSEENGDVEEGEIEDYQLSRAVDLIRGVSLYEGRLLQMHSEEQEQAAIQETSDTDDADTGSEGHSGSGND